QGALATFCGLVVKPARTETGGGWWAMAVGDSCLFQVRGGNLITSFPLTRSAEFNNQPAVLGSRGTYPRQAWKRTRGRWQPADRFFLMTDALAEWFLRQSEMEQRPWEALARVANEPAADAAFAAWMQERRDQSELRNDDVTLMTIDV